MIVWLERIVWASISAGVTGVLALGLCRLPGVGALVKLWLCRIASLKFLVTLLTTAAVSITVLPAPPAGAGDSGNTRLLWLSSWLFATWAAGALVVARHVVRSQRLALELLDSSIPSPLDVQTTVQELCRQMDVHQDVDVRTSIHLSQPCVCASRKPTILVPEQFDPEGCRHVLAHEVAHIRHRDLWWGRVQAIVFAFFWFHPAVAWLEAESRLWQEVAADAVSRETTKVQPKQQADTIVGSLAGLRSYERANVVALGQHGTKEIVSRRLRALYENRPSRIAAIAVVLFAGAAVVPIRLDAAPQAWPPAEAPRYGEADAVAVPVTSGPRSAMSPIASVVK